MCGYVSWYTDHKTTKKPGLLLVAIPDLGIHCKESDFRISRGEGSYTNADYA